MNDSEQDIWLRRFDQENVQVIVLSLRDDDDLVKTLRRQPGWLIDFEGDGAVIFTRSASSHSCGSTRKKDLHQLFEQCSFAVVETDVLHPAPVNYYLLAQKA